MGDERRGFRAEVGEDEAAECLHGVRLQLDPAGERGVRRLSGHFQTLAGLVIQPAVVRAAEPVLLGDAKEQVHPAMGARGVDEPQLATRVTVEDEILAQEANRFGRVLLQLCQPGDGLPVAAHQLAHRGSGTNLGQSIVLLFG